MIAKSRQRSAFDGLRELWNSAAGFVPAMLVAAAISACGKQAPADPLLNAPLAILDGEWNGDDARIEGRLELRVNCLYISPRVGAPYAGDLAYLIFARDGLQWDARAQVLRIGRAEFAVGQDIAFGGSGKRDSTALEPVHWVKPPAAECDTSPIWYVGRDQD